MSLLLPMEIGIFFVLLQPVRPELFTRMFLGRIDRLKCRTNGLCETGVEVAHEALRGIALVGGYCGALFFLRVSALQRPHPITWEV